MFYLILNVNNALDNSYGLVLYNKQYLFSEIMMARLPCGCSTEVIFVLHLPPSSYFRILLFNLFNVFLMLHNVECRTMMNVAQG